MKPSKCSFFQSEIVYLAHHVSHEGIHPSKENMCMVEEFPIPETFIQVRMFCGLAGHYRHFIKGFAHIARPLYDLLGKEVKMGLVQLPPEMWEVVRILKDNIQSAPMLVFPNFDKPFLLETDASKEGFGAVLSQKQEDGPYHPITLGVTPQCHQRKITTALNLSSLPSSGVSLNTSRSTLHTCHSWHGLTTIH